MRRTLAITGLVVLALGMGAEAAKADPPCGRGWRRGEYCGRHDDRRAERHYRHERREVRRDWDRRDWERRDPRHAYGYAPPAPRYVVPQGPTFQLNIR